MKIIESTIIMEIINTSHGFKDICRVYLKLQGKKLVAKISKRTNIEEQEVCRLLINKFYTKLDYDNKTKGIKIWVKPSEKIKIEWDKLLESGRELIIK